MNLAVHALAGDIRKALTYYEDLHRAPANLISSSPIPRSTSTPWTRNVWKATMIQGRRFPFALPSARQRQLSLDSTLLLRVE